MGNVDGDQETERVVEETGPDLEAEDALHGRICRLWVHVFIRRLNAFVALYIFLFCCWLLFVVTSVCSQRVCVILSVDCLLENYYWMWILSVRFNQSDA